MRNIDVIDSGVALFWPSNWEVNLLFIRLKWKNLRASKRAWLFLKKIIKMCEFYGISEEIFIEKFEIEFEKHNLYATKNTIFQAFYEAIKEKFLKSWLEKAFEETMKNDSSLTRTDIWKEMQCSYYDTIEHRILKVIDFVNLQNWIKSILAPYYFDQISQKENWEKIKIKTKLNIWLNILKSFSFDKDEFIKF